MIERDSNSYDYGCIIALESRELFHVTNENENLRNNSSIVKYLNIVRYGCFLMAILIILLVLIIFIFGIIEAYKNYHSKSLINLNHSIYMITF